MSTIIGIDLGTTNSCVAIMENGKPKVIENVEGVRTTPSMVAFAKDNTIIVGDSAKRQAVTNPENTISAVKRLIGRNFTDPIVKKDQELVSYKIVRADNNDAWVEISGKKYSPSEISAKILQKMKESAESYLGRKVEKAVITVPAYFNDAQRQATKDAGRIAGLEVLRIINEPTAAALAYGFDKSASKTIIVYDLGGGTFDVSVLEIGDGLFQVKSTNGNTYLGGEDFDMVILDFLVESFKTSNGIDLKKDPLALQRLKEASEKAKKELSTVTQTEINLPYITADASGPKHMNINFTRAKLESLVEKLIEATIEPCKKALADAGLKTSEIDEVVLVGGMTRMPRVIEKVKEFFGREPHKGVNPDEVVALGAALQAGIISQDVKDIVLVDVIPLSLGIETMGGIFTRLIERNSAIPTKKSQVFSTAEDNQPAVTIRVFQGERELAVHNKLLGEFNLEGIPPSRKGTPQIEVTFDIDANGIVNVSAKDRASGKEQKVSIKASGGLSEEEIKSMVEDAAKNEVEDKKRKELIDARNKADSTIYNLESTLKEYADKIPEAEKEASTKAIEDLKAVINSEDAQEINTKIDALTEIAMKIGQAMYQKQGPEMPGENPTNDTTSTEGEIIEAEVKEEKK